MKDNCFSLKWLLSQNWNEMVNVIWKCQLNSFLLEQKGRKIQEPTMLPPHKAGLIPAVVSGPRTCAIYSFNMDDAAMLWVYYLALSYILLDFQN